MVYVIYFLLYVQFQQIEKHLQDHPGERLGDWAVAVEVAESVLSIERFNPLLRTEAHRLLGQGLMGRGLTGHGHGTAHRAGAGLGAERARLVLARVGAGLAPSSCVRFSSAPWQV